MSKDSQRFPAENRRITFKGTMIPPTVRCRYLNHARIEIQKRGEKTNLALLLDWTPTSIYVEGGENNQFSQLCSRVVFYSELLSGAVVKGIVGGTGGYEGLSDTCGPCRGGMEKRNSVL